MEHSAIYCAITSGQGGASTALMSSLQHTQPSSWPVPITGADFGAVPISFLLNPSGPSGHISSWHNSLTSHLTQVSSYYCPLLLQSFLQLSHLLISLSMTDSLSSTKVFQWVFVLLESEVPSPLSVTGPVQHCHTFLMLTPWPPSFLEPLWTQL